MNFPSLIGRVAAVSAFGLAAGLIQAAPSGAEPAADAAAGFTPTLTSVACPDLTSGGASPTPPRTKCSTLTVPLYWSTPNYGRTVDILVAVTSAKRKPGRLGLTWNPGGPGGEAIPRVGEFYAYLPKSIQDNFDFVSSCIFEQHTGFPIEFQFRTDQLQLIGVANREKNASFAGVLHTRENDHD